MPAQQGAVPPRYDLVLRGGVLIDGKAFSQVSELLTDGEDALLYPPQARDGLRGALQLLR